MFWMLINEVFNVFSGHWTLRRHVSSPSVFMEGVATFTRQNKELIFYQEQAEYRLNTMKQLCSQSYFYELSDPILSIRKRDLTLLHTFILGGPFNFPLQLTHQHICKKDIYECYLTINNLNLFTISTVPQKNIKLWRIVIRFFQKMPEDFWTLDRI